MVDSKENILSCLNEEQKIATINYTGPQFLVAGPGSGKTLTLVKRTSYMIADGINPENILLFTFTNKAAKEIKERISKEVGNEVAKKITTGTYHSFCCRLLRKYGDKLGYEKGWSIFDAEDSKKVLNKITKGTDVDSKILGSYISNQKRKMISPQKALEDSFAKKDDLAKFYETYQRSLFNQNAMDFDDLIYNTIRLLSNNEDVKRKVNNRWRYIAADESHDSSSADITFITLLAGDDENVCFILDDHQSIYSFRGANLNAVLNVKNIYPNLKTYYLNQNYRCSGTIVEASKSLISHNSNQLDKNIFTDNEDGDKIILFEEINAQMEATRIAKMIQLLISKYGYEYKDIAILYRTSNLSRVVEEIFLKYKIPYRILSGVNFYQRKEVKDIIAFIRFLCNQYDFEAFSRIINIPKRGIGDKTIEKIIDKCNSQLPQIDLLTSCRLLSEENAFKGKAKKGIEDFIKLIDKYNNIKDSITVPELINGIIKNSNYYVYLKEEDEKEYEDRMVNIIELVELSHSFNSLEEFLEQTSLDRLEEEDLENSVQMLTMHMSKGLEWKAVFIIGANEGTNPHFRSLGLTEKIEEERRLMYVAITRAKENLFICRPKKVMQNGYYIASKRSRFINEINPKYIYEAK